MYVSQEERLNEFTFRYVEFKEQKIINRSLDQFKNGNAELEMRAGDRLAPWTLTGST